MDRYLSRQIFSVEASDILNLTQDGLPRKAARHSYVRPPPRRQASRKSGCKA